MKYGERKLLIIKEFYAEVCELAEAKMLKTGKLEGAHFASMKEIIKRLEDEAGKENEREGD